MTETRVESWLELQECLFADSWRSELGRHRSDFVFRGLVERRRLEEDDEVVAEPVEVLEARRDAPERLGRERVAAVPRERLAQRLRELLGGADEGDHPHRAVGVAAGRGSSTSTASSR